MMRSLYAGTSGLKNHQTKMDVVGNNIANVNTTGFKRSRVNFQDLLSQNLKGAAAPQGNRGGINGQQVGLGVGMASIDVVNTPGNTQYTGTALDMAVEGDGYFVLQNGSNKVYTRAGTFDKDTKGNIVSTSNGMKVMGWMADANGVLPSRDANTLSTLRIPTEASLAAQATTSGSYSKNLNSSGNMTTTEVDLQAWNLKLDEVLTATPQVETIDVYNSEGKKINLKIQFKKEEEVGGVDTPWTMTVEPADALKTSIKDKDVTTVGGNLTLADGTIITFKRPKVETNPTNLPMSPAVAGTIPVTKINSPAKPLDTNLEVYDSQGNKHNIEVTFEKMPLVDNQWKVVATLPNGDTVPVDPVNDPPQFLTFNAQGQYVSGGFEVSYDPANGAAQMNIKLDFSKMTQYADETSVTGKRDDGYTSGTLETISADSSGAITGSFTNGQTMVLGQVALTNFTNPAGLTSLGGNLFNISNNSGEPEIGAAGVGGRGNIKPSSLEMSNVNLADEFTDMIVTQRGFQANSRIITTTDSMLEELINLKR